MILADTSVWIAHFRYGEPKLSQWLNEGVILIHPWVSRELFCANLKHRKKIFADLSVLPSAELVSDSEALALLKEHELWGKGLGWIDVHLLASAVLSACRLWTLDRRLAEATDELGLAPA